jgi:hypothetical protein
MRWLPVIEIFHEEVVDFYGGFVDTVVRVWIAALLLSSAFLSL